VQLLCHSAPGDTDADTAGIPALVVSTDSRLLAHAEAHAARYDAHRFLAKPLDFDARVTNSRRCSGTPDHARETRPVRAMTLL
jgi:hypothetical protein